MYNFNIEFIEKQFAQFKERILRLNEIEDGLDALEPDYLKSYVDELRIILKNPSQSELVESKFKELKLQTT
jgi:hypothetical protein